MMRGDVALAAPSSRVSKTTPPPKPSKEGTPAGRSKTPEQEEYWDYAEDLERAEAEIEAEADGEAEPTELEAEDDELDEADEADEADELDEVDEDELDDDDELDEVDEDELDDDDDDDDEADEDLADEDALELDEEESAPRSRAPLIWAAAAAAWAGVMLVKFTGDDAPPAGPSLTVQRGDEVEAADEPEPREGVGPREAGELDDESGPPPAPEPEPESKIKLPRAPGGKWWNPNWDQGLTVPSEVLYTVKRGGSIQFIANLYKIYHHEIQSWNPGIPLEKDLGPGTKVVVYKPKHGVRSESVGLPSRGQLRGAVPMLDGPGRILKHTPWKGWATAETVAIMDKALSAWSERGSDAKPVQPVLVGNMSAREGGRLKPHGSHQSGRDVDLSYIQKGPDTADLNWREMNAQNLDAGETWRLLETLVATGAVEHIFIDTQLQKLLHDYAVEQKLISKRDLATWLEYPRPPGSVDTVVQHVRGHVDHIHVRFACPSSQKSCQTK